MGSFRPALLIDLGKYSLSAYELGGVGLRAIEIAQTLRSRVDVRLFAPAGSPQEPHGVEIIAEVGAWSELLAESDAVLFFDLASRDRLDQAVRSRKLIITESTAPLEQLEYASIQSCSDPEAAYREHTATFARQLQVSHHFICRSSVERATLAANLCHADRLTPADIGRSRNLEHLVSLVPIGYSADSARAAAAVTLDPVADFLWTGGLWSFYDPETLVDAVAICLGAGVDLSVAFLHGQSSTDNENIIERLSDRIRERGVSSAVMIQSKPMTADERHAKLRAARAAVCLGRPGVENETCVRLRIRDSRLYGLPLIVDRHGGTAAEAMRDGFGRVVGNDGALAVAEKLTLAMATEKKDLERMDSYCYDSTLEGFTRWLIEAC